MIIQFKLPTTKMSVIVWYRNGQKNEELVQTPKCNIALRDMMLKKRVGMSEIRAVKPVEPMQLLGTKFA